MSNTLPDAEALLALVDAVANPRAEAFELAPASGGGEDFGREWRMDAGPFAWRLSVPERFWPRSGDSAHETLDFPVRLEEARRSIEAWATERLDPALASALRLRLRFSRRETGVGHPLSVLVSTFVDAAPIDALRSKVRNADPFASLGEAFAAVSAAASLLESGWLPDPPGAAWHHCEAYIHHDVGVKGTFGSSRSGSVLVFWRRRVRIGAGQAVRGYDAAGKKAGSGFRASPTAPTDDDGRRARAAAGATRA